ncbi:MAG: glutaredoxin family protein [Gammaproteobacteria bacterium]
MRKLFLALAIFAMYLGWTKWHHAAGAGKQYAALHTEKVVLYATSWCGYCAKTRQFLTQNDIPYFEYDIEKSEEGQDQFEELGGRGVPLVLVKGQPIFGYNPDAIREKL